MPKVTQLKDYGLERTEWLFRGLFGPDTEDQSSYLQPDPSASSSVPPWTTPKLWVALSLLALNWTSPPLALEPSAE